MSLQHVVLFSFSNELSAEDESELFAEVRAWPERIGGFSELRLARSVNTERTRGYQYLLYMVVADEKALAVYQEHPVHQGFAAFVVDHGGTVLAFDYHLDADSVIVPPLA